jgi:quercetin dioxygenase-like cupin family protein
MQVNRGRTSDPVQPGTAFAPHTGEVQLDSMLSADGVFVNAAVYSPCARTYWHVHERGQVMLVTAGKGAVVTRDGQVAIVHAGDVTHTPPGEEHWHGAAPDCFVTYTSISLGSVETLDEVTADEYQSVWRSVA